MQVILAVAALYKVCVEPPASGVAYEGMAGCRDEGMY
jgi:hypothetical protein